MIIFIFSNYCVCNNLEWCDKKGSNDFVLKHVKHISSRVEEEEEEEELRSPEEAGVNKVYVHRTS